MKFNLNSYASHFLNCVWLFIHHLTRSLVGCILAEWVYLTIEFINKMFIWQFSLSNILNILGTYFLCSVCAITTRCYHFYILNLMNCQNQEQLFESIYRSMFTHFACCQIIGKKIIAQIKSATKTKKYTKDMYLLNGALKQEKKCVCCKLNHKNQLVWYRGWGTLKKSLELVQTDGNVCLRIYRTWIYVSYLEVINPQLCTTETWSAIPDFIFLWRIPGWMYCERLWSTPLFHCSF